MFIIPFVCIIILENIAKRYTRDKKGWKGWYDNTSEYYLFDSANFQPFVCYKPNI